MSLEGVFTIARVKSFFVEFRHRIVVTTISNMAAVVDTESEDPATNLIADEPKESSGSCSAGLGTQLRQRVVVYTVLLFSVCDDHCLIIVISK